MIDDSPGARAVVFTDGACIGNPGPGGWAWALGTEEFASGFSPATTNQRMELTAVVRALEEIPGRVQVVSDSTYVVNCFRDRWYEGWRRRGWRSSKGQPVMNQDLWRPLIEEVVDRRAGLVTFRWVKGHAGDVMNDFVDRLANDAARLQEGTARPLVGGGSATPDRPGPLRAKSD